MTGKRDELQLPPLPPSTTGTESLHLARMNPYDGIVLDMMLPGIDGWSIIRALRQRGIASPVMCLTARDGLEDRVRGLDLGADDYLVKPFEWDEFLARLRALIRRGHGGASAMIQVEDLEIDTARKTARRNARDIPLTEREYTLLEYLARRQGQVVSRTEIWGHLWDQHDEATSNVVDVYVGYLRRKIDQGFETKLIHTRRGLGYMFGPRDLERATS